jgi:hypothetical protein
MIGRMPAVELSPAQVGGDTGGFRVVMGLQAMRIEAWGYWPSDVVGAFARETPGAIQRLAPTTSFTLDANQLKPQGAEGQESLRVLFRALAPLAFARGTIVASNALTRMQLTRLVRECSMVDRLIFDDSSP